MRVVHKFPISTDTCQLTIKCSVKDKIVLFDVQKYKPTLWIERNIKSIEPAKLLYETVDKTFIVKGTGHIIENNLEHVASAMCRDTGLLYHLYQVE